MWQVGSTCYGTKTAALQSAVSAESGTVVQHGGAAHVVTVSGVGENGVEYTLVPLGGGSAVVTQVLQEPQPCNLLTVDDVGPIGWAICGGWVVIYCIKLFLQARPIDDT